MINDFLAFNDRQNLFSSNQKILLAVSGGIDSVVMAHLFFKSGFNFALAHCNFKLRGSDADADEEFVKTLAKKWQSPFFSTSFDTKKYATENGISTQEAARDLRYSWFNEILDKERFDYVATAHHLNDSYETVIYNLVKGTGIDGLTGIAPKKDRIIRPLLFSSRKAIENWAAENQLSWREDASNASDDYSRNLIRNRIFPELEKINPSLVDTFRNTQARLVSTSSVVEKEVENFKGNYTKQSKADILIDKKALIDAELVVVDELLKKYGFNIEQVKDIMSILESGQSGKIFRSENFQLNIDRDQLLLSPTASLTADNGFIKEEQSVFSNQYFTLKMSKSAVEKHLDFDKFSAILDYDKLYFPLIVRKWEEGDAFQPLGMRGKKKLSDFMIDSKIPLNLKERVYVLESGGEIAWVIGHRLDERFKVEKDTNRVLNFLLAHHD